MTLFTTIKKANSNLLRTKFRSFLTILSVTIGVITLSLIMVIGTGFEKWIDNQTKGIPEDFRIIVNPKGANDPVIGGLSSVKEYEDGIEYGSLFKNLTQQDSDKLRKIEGVARVEIPLTSKITYMYAKINNSKKIYSDLQVIYPREDFLLYAGSTPKSEDTKNIIMSYEVVQKLGYNDPKDILGKEVELKFKKDDGGEYVKKANVLGVSKNSVIYNSLNIIPEKMLKEIFDETVIETTKTKNQGSVSFNVIPKDGLSKSQIQEIREKIKPDYDISTSESSRKSLSGVLSVLQAILGVFTAIGLVAGFFGVINTLFTSSLERTKEIGMMRALGMSKNGIFLMFATEAIMIGFWSSVIGLSITSILTLIANQVTKNIKLFGFENGDIFSLSFINILIVIGSISLITLIAGIIPAIRASNIEPTEALKYE